MYHAPVKLADALQIVAERNGKIVAGGTDVYPAAQQGKRPAFFLDVTRIHGFNTISHTADGYRIGAAVTWTQLVHANLPSCFDGLKQAAREVGSVQIQNAGTVAGNLCNASPAADGVPPLLALDAAIEIESSARGKRILPLSEFLLSVRHTALAPDELVTAILVPPQPAQMTSGFEKLGSRRYLVISITMTAANITCDDQGLIAMARVAVGACSPVAQRLPQLEASLVGQDPQTVSIDPGHLADLAPISDVRGTTEFRFDVVAEQCARAIQKAAHNER